MFQGRQMSDPFAPPAPLRVNDLPTRTATSFELRPDPPVCKLIADELELSGLRKLSFVGTVRADGKESWRLDGRLGASVVQPCAVTLVPVRTRIEVDVTRRYLRDLDQPQDEEEVEMTNDETIDALGETIDPYEVMMEALALNLPLYPRSEAATLGEAIFAPPGVAPMRDEDTRAFAGLAALRDKIGSPDKDEGEK
jgi:uncharacterized metal-binding protein YceD (DUF177 family)